MVKQSTSEGVAPTAAPATTAPAASAAPYNAPVVNAPVPARFSRVVGPLRIVQLILGIIVLGLTAFLVSDFSAFNAQVFGIRINLGQCAFNLFNGIWTLLVCIYLIMAAFQPKFHNSIAALVLDAISVVFWFAGFIALAVFTAGIQYAWVDWTDENLPSADFGCLVAAVVFGFFNCVLFICTLIFTALGQKSASANYHAGTPMQQYPGQGVAQHV